MTMDPRVDASTEVLERQFALADSIYVQTLSTRKAMAELESVESQLKKLDAKDENNPPFLAEAIHNALVRLRRSKAAADARTKERKKRTRPR